jgi:hypothetical protein
MQKLELKSIYKLLKNCSSSHTEHNKIGFVIFRFFYDFISILQFLAQGVKSDFWFYEQVPGFHS